ncbi:hypothetical protein PQX77_015251 [Marasmius sp. AFHP31]|nr:hypothetical protein PQX77_015251 [Marasmius sp. AFHP31]
MPQFSPLSHSKRKASRSPDSRTFKRHAPSTPEEGEVDDGGPPNLSPHPSLPPKPIAAAMITDHKPKAKIAFPFKTKKTQLEPTTMTNVLEAKPSGGRSSPGRGRMHERPVEAARRSSRDSDTRLKRNGDGGGGRAGRHHHDSSLQRYGLPSITNSWTAFNDAPAVPRSPIPDEHSWTEDPLPTPMYISILPKASCSLSGVDKSLYDSSSSLGAESHPRPIRDIDPRLTLTYYSLLGPSARSCFNVYSPHGLIHTEDSPVTLASTSDDGTYYYSTVLVPGFWENLCNHSDPTEFTIEHKVIQDAPPLEPPVLYTAVYKFRYPKEIGTRPVPRFSPADLDVLRDLTSPSSVEEDFPASTPSDHDIFDLSDLGLTTSSVNAPTYTTCGRSNSLPNTPRVGDKELYSQRRGSDPVLQQHWLHRSSP